MTTSVLTFELIVVCFAGTWILSTNIRGESINALGSSIMSFPFDLKLILIEKDAMRNIAVTSNSIADRKSSRI